MNGFLLASILFANPWGAWALLGIPAVILIHFLQRKSKVLRISTLFLLEKLSPDSRQGQRLTWLQQSLSFWLQILCVLLLAWVLMEPRWLKSNTAQRVFLVLDSSLSMSAYEKEWVEQLTPHLRRIDRLASRTVWTVLETDPDRGVLYEGDSWHGLDQALRNWQPSMPMMDPGHALELARSLAPADSLVIFVTYKKVETPSGVDLISVGEPIENCGLTGMRMQSGRDGMEWQVLAMNFGRKKAQRNWWVEIPGLATSKQTLELEPEQPKVLKGLFPPGINRQEVCLESDRFAMDDRMPLIRPEPKALLYEVRGSQIDDAAVIAKLAQSIPNLSPAGNAQSPDVLFLVLKAGTWTLPPLQAAVILSSNSDSKESLIGGPFVVVDDPLNKGLNWQGLIFQPQAGFTLLQEDRVLLWRGETPVIVLRASEKSSRQLLFNLNFSNSNLARLPAFVLLVNRFMEMVRQDKLAPEAGNLDVAQYFTVRAEENGGTMQIKPEHGKAKSVAGAGAFTVRAPSVPGFFTVEQGPRQLFRGAAQFVDVRLSDFQEAEPADTLAQRDRKLVEAHSESDFLTPLWLLLIVLALLVNWYSLRPSSVEGKS